MMSHAAIDLLEACMWSCRYRGNKGSNKSFSKFLRICTAVAPLYVYAESTHQLKEYFSAMGFAAPFDFSTEQMTGGSAGFGPEQDEREQTEHTLRELSRRFQKVLSADKEVCQQISEEMAMLEKELARLEETTLQVENQYRQDSQANDRLAEEAQQLQHKVAEAQQRLLELRDDCRALNLESLSLRRDRNHLVEELGFLQRSLDDEMHTLHALEQMNANFQAFHDDMEANAELLLHQRKELMGQVSKERELSRQDARQNNELRNLLERRKREQAVFASGGSRQSATPKDSAVQSAQSPAISSDHSWASFLSQPAVEKDKAAAR
ncbi:CARNS1 [Symbiodinium natans]|uniref:CARNS1 protein n=1 Tax=Symbiodinium natans TaxID=878477 RepID=A0A812RR01_9DINO|nr:CARNS1 [Symbiodinium natans]